MEALVERYHGPVMNFAARFVGHGDPARDIAQEVFIKVIRRLDTFDARADFQTWIFAITANACRDALRRRKRHREVLEADGPDLCVITDRVADDDVAVAPERLLLRKVGAMPVRRAVRDLPEPHRTAIILRFFHDMSLKEIAEVCQCSVGTIGSRLHYAIKRLKSALASEDSETGGNEDELRTSQDPIAGA
jgi:RNA polymerase sigma-70 factor (ECF subfamily)